MPLFSQRGEESEQDNFFPSEALGVVRVGAVLLVAGVLVFELGSPTREPTDAKFAYGCFLSNDAPPISVGPSGVVLAGEAGAFTVPFKLEYAKGYELSLDGSYKLVPHGSFYRWEPSNRGWSYLMRYRHLGPLGEADVADPNDLHEFDVVTEDARFLRFRRAGADQCS